MNSRSHSWWLSLLAVALAVGCFAGAAYFHGRYESARREISHALRQAGAQGNRSEVAGNGAATRDGYLLRAWWMFYACVGVWAFSLLVALRDRRRASWLAVVVVGAIAVAIPLGVLWVI